MFCPKCGAAVSDGAGFCGSCGAQLNAAGQQANVPASPYAAGTAASGTNPYGAQGYAQPQNPYAQGYAQPQSPYGAQGNVQTQNPYASANYGQAGNPYATANPYAQPKAKRSILPIVAAAIVVVALGVVGAGFALGWFGGGASGAGGVGGSKSGPVYIVTSRTADGYSFEAELDDHGNPISTKTVNGNGPTVTQKYSVDENGYITKVKSKFEMPDGGSTTNALEYENEFDDDGRIIHAEGDNQEVDYEYYDNGMLKSRVTVTYGNTETEITIEYDENGYETRFAQVVRQGKDEMTNVEYNFEWEFDSSDQPTSVTAEMTVNGTTETQELDVELDEDGNIIALESDDGYRLEFEYAKIDDPSPAARMQASQFSYIG